MLTSDNPRQQDNIVLLKSDVAMRKSFVWQNIAYADTANTKKPSSYYYDGRKAMQQCTQLLRKMHNTELEC